jgi:ribosomal protein L40E
MKKCCHFWHEQKKIYETKICHGVEEDKVSPFVQRMRRVEYCPECGGSFNKFKVCDKCYGLNDLNSSACSRCGHIILEN